VGENTVVGLHTRQKPTGTTKVHSVIRFTRVAEGAWSYRQKIKHGSFIEGVGLAMRGEDGVPTLRVSTQHVIAKGIVHYTTGVLRATRLRGAHVRSFELTVSSTNFTPLVVHGPFRARSRGARSHGERMEEGRTRCNARD
jgi:hypothetical protein